MMGCGGGLWAMACAGARAGWHGYQNLKANRADARLVVETPRLFIHFNVRSEKVPLVFAKGWKGMPQYALKIIFKKRATQCGAILE